MIKGYVLDLDGTLLDSLAVWDHVGEEFLKKNHVAIPDDFQNIIEDMSFAQSASYCIELGNLPYTIEEVCASFYQAVEAEYRFKVQGKHHIKEFLKNAVQKNISLGIATTLEEGLSNEALERLGIRSYFSFILTCDVIGFGKDNPTIYKKAAELMDLLPKEIMVFEDALYCMKTAKEAGFHVCGVFDSRQQMMQSDIELYCDQYIFDFKEFIE